MNTQIYPKNIPGYQLKQLIWTLVLLMVGAVSSAQDQSTLDPSSNILSGEGRITDIDYGRQLAQISGLTFRFPLDAKVEINNSFGAFTLLKREMIVSFSYKETKAASGKSERTIIQLRQLPDDYPLVEL